MSSSDEVLARYVDAALALHYPDVPADTAERVRAQFVRIAQIVAPVLAYHVDASDEPAPVYHP
ncbi:AtzG-like protein [Caballeronia temeraria]|nr:AtzG-like protein [Caballeronia temeraria]